jgi:hypothetical protein
MKKALFFLTVLGLISTQLQAQWKSLFNGKNLSGWDTYLGPPFPAVGENRTGVPPIGLNTDPKKVFSVVKLEGENVMRISGENFGGISTKDEFENYHLRLEFKWGKLKWPPKENSKMDSGLLYHANGKHGADSGFWMQSQEFQIQEGDCGDYWGCAGAIFDVPAVKDAKGEYHYSKKGELLTFQDKTPVGRHCIKEPDAENPTGEWNTVDLYCFGDTAVHVINGKVTMVLYHSKRKVENGLEPLKKGKIQIQCEGAEVFYKNIKIESIAALPTHLTGN